MGDFTLSLAQRTRVSKMYSKYCRDNRIDLVPTTFLAWLEMQGYLVPDKIREDLAKEKEELKKEDKENDI